MKTTNYWMIFALFLVLGACSRSTENSSNPLEWKYENGWAFKKSSSDNTFEKFFAIGTWHVPGYVFTDSVESDALQNQKNASLFLERTAPINMVFVTAGFQKDYMSEKIHVLNPFSPILYKFMDQVPGLPNGKDKDYYRSQHMKKIADTPEFEEYLDAEIKKILETLPNNQYIYSHIDEIALGGVSKWAVPPVMGAKINEKLKQNDPGALLFVDLLGHSKGSTYLFEKKYLQTHDALPEDPPYEFATPGAQDCNIPLLGFYQAYNGLPVYKFSDGKYFYSNYDFEILKSIWYENTKLVATGYKGCGNVFGINAFRDHFSYPALAGTTVDALRAGLGENTPIWLYFDGNGYAKPSDMTPVKYIEIVKCQIYTAIIHGATGILFWNDWSKTPEVFDVLLPMLKELNDNLDIIYRETIDKKIAEDLHIAIKKEGKKKYIIASNTSKTDTLPLNMPGMQKETLSPLEVYISEM